MEPIVMHRRLGPLTDAQLRTVTRRLALALRDEHANGDGSYAPFWQDQLSRLRAEWMRRGEQLSLF